MLEGELGMCGGAGAKLPIVGARSWIENWGFRFAFGERHEAISGEAFGSAREDA